MVGALDSRNWITMLIPYDHTITGMKLCAGLLVMILVLVCPVHAGTFIDNCGSSLDVGHDAADLRIDSVPAGALVLIDNATAGTTPFEGTMGAKGLMYNTHLLTLTRAGNVTEYVKFDLCFGRMTTVRVDLLPLPPAPVPTRVVTPSSQQASTVFSGGESSYDIPAPSVTTTPPATGSLSVTTTPAGAEVYLDGSYRGITPVTLTGIAPGTRTLVIRQAGYADDQLSVAITAGKTLSYTTELIPSSLPAGPATTTRKVFTPGFTLIPALGGALGTLLIVRRTR